MMVEKKVRIFNVKPGHARMTIGELDGNDTFILWVSDQEAHGSDFPNEDLKLPLTGFVIHSVEMAEGLAEMFAHLAEEMREREHEDDEIRVGDEVANETDPAKRFFVTHVGNGFVSGVSMTGGLYKTKPTSSWKKTGHRNELLAQALTEEENG